MTLDLRDLDERIPIHLDPDLSLDDDPQVTLCRQLFLNLFAKENFNGNESDPDFDGHRFVDNDC